MDLLVALHRFALPIPIVGHHLVLLTALLFLLSLPMLARPAVPSWYVVLLRVTWAAFALNTLSGLILGLTGQKVPSAVPATPGGNVTAVGFPPDPSRHWEHLMYAGFAILSLYIMEVLVAGRALPRDRGLRFMPLLTLFLVCVAYMSVRVAYLPGSTPGT
ncbi:hypothetical protein [Deinococcus pimensis]|uniref:hypothetical protein n=1 Tax=Deinococcus pimensis TaxID=309888 RepID=UPI00047F9F4B|nr:hypothetical protein [Deinococcus pimensis]